MGYKTEGWQDIKVGDKIEVLHHNYGNDIHFKDRVIEVHRESPTWIWITVAAQGSDGYIFKNGLALIVGENEVDQVKLIEKKEENDIMKNIDVDWSKAPEGTTHFNPKGSIAKWYKKNNKVWKYYSDLSSCWEDSGNPTSDIKNYIQRPQCNLSEWKIKHIKSDDYKCGRDAALTIIYKDIGNGYYEYKYAICNPKDMFCRKKGVEVALNKLNTFKCYVKNFEDTDHAIVVNLTTSVLLSDTVIGLIFSKYSFFA